MFPILPELVLRRILHFVGDDPVDVAHFIDVFGFAPNPDESFWKKIINSTWNEDQIKNPVETVQRIAEAKGKRGKGPMGFNRKGDWLGK